MLTLKKQSNGDYNIALQKPTELLDKDVAQKIKKEVKRLIQKDRVLNINLDDVEDFAESGYKVLGDVVRMAQRKNCHIKFTVDGIDLTGQLKSINNSER